MGVGGVEITVRLSTGVGARVGWAAVGIEVGELLAVEGRGVSVTG